MHESLRLYDHRSRDLVARIEEFGRSIRPADLVGRDIVHWDLHPGNILADDERLRPITDTDFAVVGDARFDLVARAVGSLAISCDDGVRSRLFGAAFEGLGDVEGTTYVGHLLVRIIDWLIRRGKPEEVEFWLAHCNQLFPICARTSGHGPLGLCHFVFRPSHER